MPASTSSASKKRMRWGILGAGNIAHRFMESIAHHLDCRVLKVSARNEAKAIAFTKQYNIPMYTRIQEELFNDPAIDALYVALPHKFHKETIIKALKAGKAVLCEKPLSLNEADVQEIIQVQNETGLLCMEAMKTRFTPAYKAMKKEASSLGSLHLIETIWDLNEQISPSSYFWDVEQGGILLDCGIYGVGLIQDMMKEDVEQIQTDQIIENGVDIYTRSVLTYPSCQASVECAIDRTEPIFARLTFEHGVITIPNFHRMENYIVEKEGKVFERKISYEVDDFYGEIDHFVKLWQEKSTMSPVMPLQDSLDCAFLIDQIKRAAS